MPKVTPLINNFNGGELDPKLDTRSDINKYYSGCRTLQNMVPLVEGSAKRMPGTFHVDTLGVKARIVPFHFSTTQAYIIAITGAESLMTFYKDNGKIIVAAADVDAYSPNELVTVGEFRKHGYYFDLDCGSSKHLYFAAPYAAADPSSLLDITVVINSGDTLAVSYATGVVTVKLANGTSTLNTAAAIQTALRALGTVNTVDLSSWTVTEDAAYTAARPTTGVNVTDTTTTAGGLYRCIQKVVASTVNSSKFPDVETSYWTEWTANAKFTITHTYTEAELFELKFAQSADVLYIFHPSHAPAKLIRLGHFEWRLSDLLTTNADQASTVSAVTKDTQAKITLASAAAYKVGDMLYFSGLGGMTELNGNTYKIVRRISTTVFRVDVDSTDFTTFTTGGTVTKRFFYSVNEYPACGCFFEQRLCMAGAYNHPTTVEMSVVADYENFSPDPDDDSSRIKYVLASRSVDRIRWMAGVDFLMLGTAGGIWKLGSSSQGNPVTPTNVSTKKQITIGVSDIDCYEVSDGILFAPRSSMGLRKVAYSFESDKWVSYNMARLADHISKGSTLALSGFKQFAWQEEPYPILWGIRKDGQLIGMTYETQEEVYAWFRVKTGDTTYPDVFESVAVISQDGYEDQVWVVVKRRIYTESWDWVYCIEYFAPHEFFGDIKDAFFVHCGRTYDAGNVAVTVTDITNANPAVVIAPGHSFVNGNRVRISGSVFTDTGMLEVNQDYTQQYTVANANIGAGSFELSGVDSRTWGDFNVSYGASVIKVVNTVTSVLFGRVVIANVDGYVSSSTTVSLTGTATLNLYGNKFQIGLAYDSIVEPMKLHAGSQQGTARGKVQKINKVTCCFHETGEGVEAGPNSSTLLSVPGLTPGLLTTVDTDFEFPGDWNKGATLYLKQSKPLPMTILALVPRLSLNED